MSDEHMKNIVRGFLKSIVEGDVTKSLSFLHQDIVWMAPQGAFTGYAEVENYLTWMKQNAKDPEINETGIGIITKGSIAVTEHSLAGTTDDMRWEIPAVGIYQFNDGKIQNMRLFYDTLAQVKQVVKGGLPKLAVNSVANACVKGLY